MSNTLTPMFDKKVKPITLPNQEQTTRKTRKDKKKQIKVPVTKEQKLMIGKLCLLNGYRGDIHPYLDMIFSIAVERNFIEYASAVPYKDTLIYVSTKIPLEVYEKIIQLKVNWGLRSVRQAAHRILINEIQVS